MRAFWSWLDNNVLFLITGFLLAFIPLFPKLPLFEAIPGYIVRVRLEDFLIGITLIIWLIQLWRRKVSLGPNPLTKPILIYLTVGVLSMISAVFVTRTVPLETLHVGKMVLHFLRRVEYFSLFFVFYSSIKSLTQVKIYLVILLAAVVGVVIYGYGQKYLYWPAYSTMNREFAKGWALYLTEHARVLSTFGGHYDLAAFMMVILVMLWAFFFSFPRWWQKVAVFVLLASSFWLLILTVSRTSFIAYIVGVTGLFILLMFKKGIGWSVKRWLAVVVLSMVVMLLFGDLSDRFLKLLKLEQRITGVRSLLTRPVSAPPTGTEIAYLENNIEAVTSKSDFPPLPIRPSDVLEEQPDFISTSSATGAAIAQVIPRTYSQTARVYDLSTGIRLDALWPRAIAGFLRNPLLGSGYSTLTKTQVTEFTEAESTDNDFLRALGETGILGFLAFGWILGTILVFVFKSFLAVEDRVLFAFSVGLVAAVIGLLVNAVYIDIFEASKVAFSFWALTGIVLGGLKVVNPRQTRGFPKIPQFKESINTLKQSAVAIVRSHKSYLVLIILIAFVLRHFRIHEPLADWHSWRQADTSAVTRNFVRYGIDLLYPRYDDLSSIASGQPNPHGYRFVELPLYNAVTVIVDRLFPGFTLEYSGRLTSIFASLGTLVFLYLIVRKYLGDRPAFLAAFFFAVIPYNIYWSRVILPEPTLTFLTTAMLYFFDRWLEKGSWGFWVVSLLLAQSALLVKFTAVFFIIPMGYLAIRKWRRKAIAQPALYAYGILVLLPFFAWRWHISRFPEGIPAYTWLLNGNGIRFKGAWFWWLFAERMARLILGGWGVSLLVLGLLRPMKFIGEKSRHFLSSLVAKFTRHSEYNWFFHFWLVGILVYFTVFATGNVQHDYYQIIMVPILTVFLAWGSEVLLRAADGFFHTWLSRVVLVIVIVFMLMFGWYQARDFYNINHPEIVEAGREFDRLVTNQQVKVIAPYGGDTAFLYQTGKRGWPVVEGTIDEMVNKGAHYYISVNYDDLTKDLMRVADEVKTGVDQEHAYKVIKQTDTYIIIQLVPDRLLPKV